MKKIPTLQIRKVFDGAAAELAAAAGANGKISQDEVRQLVAALGGNEKRLLNEFYAFAQERSGNGFDALPIRQVKEAAAAASREVAASDRNRDGFLSKSEVNKMPALAKLAVSVVEDQEKGKLTAQLAARFAEASRGVVYISESDYAPQFVAGSLPQGALTKAGIQGATVDEVLRFFKGQVDPSLTREKLDYRVETINQRERFFKRLKTPSDPSDPPLVRNAEGFKRVLNLVDRELVDVKLVKATLKEPLSQALSVYLIVGRARKTELLSGIMFGSVET